MTKTLERLVEKAEVKGFAKIYGHLYPSTEKDAILDL